MEKKLSKLKAMGSSFAYFVVATLILGIIWMTAAYGTFHYDPAFGGGVTFILFVLPLISISAVVLFFVLLFKPKHAVTAIVAFLVIFACGTYLFFYQDKGLPNSPWEYDKGLSDIFMKSAYYNDFFGIPDDYYKVYTYDREARIYRGSFYGSYKNYNLFMNGSIVNGSLFVEEDNGNYWQVYPTKCVGYTKIGDYNETIRDVVLLVNLSGEDYPSTWAHIDGNYVEGYLGIVDTDLNFLKDLDNYSFSVGDKLAIYGDYGSLPGGPSNQIVVKLESAEIVNVIPKEMIK